MDTGIELGSQAETLTRLLTRFIDPWEESFTREELMVRYGYPEDDLGEMDVDWM